MNGRSLTLDDRLRIEQLINRNICNSYIARAIDRAPSVIWYEIRHAGGREGYSAQRAHQIAMSRLKRDEPYIRQQKVLKDLKEKSRVIAATNIKEQVRQVLDQLLLITANLGKLYDNIPGETT